MFANIFRFLSSNYENTAEKLDKRKENSKCLVAKCNKRAEYTYYEWERPQFCRDHKDPGMINVVI
jgi:hypothetical protein